MNTDFFLKNNIAHSENMFSHAQTTRKCAGKFISELVKIFATAVLATLLPFSASCKAERTVPNSTKLITSDEFNAARSLNGSTNENLVTISVQSPVEHLFTHTLVSHPEIAFTKGNSYGKNLDEDCLTPKEFRAILSELYQNGYALVNATETFTEKDGKATRIPFLFPASKKPLIFSFDDVVYARKNQGKGTSSKLILDDNGKILAQTIFNDGTTKTHGEEFAPILEDFIQNYPDFSYNGARGIIFLTGFDGVLGYRTDRNSQIRTDEIQKAESVIAVLKQNGWLFGCHSYSHRHIKRSTPQQVQDDIDKWKNEVEPLTGKSTLFAYPYGEWVFGENGNDERQKALENAGFRLFFGVGNLPFYTKMPLKSNGEKYLFQDRCPMDGISLRKNACSRFFDSAAVYDAQRPMPHK